MVKAKKHSSVAAEIKKEYLKEHLEQVKELVENWLPQLEVPEPLTPQKGDSGWNMVYRPLLEEDPDIKHMLKHHLKSRALWSHHAQWERDLERMWLLVQQLRTGAYEKHRKLSMNKQWQYNDEYVIVALWQAFIQRLEGKVSNWYKAPDEPGLAFGAYRIENTARNASERSLVEKDHREFIQYLNELNQMQELAELWHEVSALTESMKSIGKKLLKSGDVLYSCMFCRHLWK